MAGQSVLDYKEIIVGSSRKVNRLHKELQQTETPKLQRVIVDADCTLKELWMLMDKFGMGRRKGRKDDLIRWLVCRIENLRGYEALRKGER